MTPKEKAENLVLAFLRIKNKNEDMGWAGMDRMLAKECALIAVDEIVNQDKGAFDIGEIHYHFEYWWKVKQEIEKL